MGAAVASTQIPAWAMHASKPAQAGAPREHLSLHEAMKISARSRACQERRLPAAASAGWDPFGSIDLLKYSSACIEALRYLTPLNGAFAFFGLEQLSPDVAEVIGAWKTGFLHFECVHSLPCASALHLGQAQTGHALSFSHPLDLSAAAAQALCSNANVIGLDLQTVPDLAIATALATHTHEISLKLPSDSMPAAVAQALSLHAGYRLDLWLPGRPTDTALRHLASNPRKRLSVTSPAECSMLGDHTADHARCLISLREETSAWTTP